MRILAFVFFMSIGIGVLAQNSGERPKLIVGIIVDQMRNDYLFRYDDLYGNDGFRKLMNDGFYCANHHFSYVPTITAPGHASVYTGTTPAAHGIVGNGWYDPRTKSSMYCVQDKSVRTVGAANADGQMSPRNLRTTTITDELMLLWNFRSKVLGVSLKDRGAILPAGHLGTAYWFSQGNFISSSYYMEELPDWVNHFNSQNLVEKYLKAGWQASFPMEKYYASEPDDSPYELTLAGEEKPLLPKDTYALSLENGGANYIKSTPYGNILTLDFAKVAIKNEQLGQDSITDFLAISLSVSDYLGHDYGVRAVEVQDLYLKLDTELADLLHFLDKEVGKGEYTLFLTADHGAAEVGSFSTDHNLPGGSYSHSELSNQIRDIVDRQFQGGASLIEKIDDNKIFI